MMPLAGKIFKFFVNSNLFIASCAVCMVNLTSQLLLHTWPDVYLVAFVFFATTCSYSFHWYLTTYSKTPSFRIEWVNRNRNIHLVLFFAGALGSAVVFLYLVEYWPWLLLSALLTFLYTAPKIPGKHARFLQKIALGKTIFLAMVWTYVTVVLPVVTGGIEWRADFYLFAVSRFFLIYAICILFDYRDREDDKAAGIRSLITWLDEAGIRNLFILSLSVFFATTICMLFYQYDLLTFFILLLPGIITAALYNHARKNVSDTLYYFVLDGLMALSGVLILLTRI